MEVSFQLVVNFARDGDSVLKSHDIVELSSGNCRIEVSTVLM